MSERPIRNVERPTLNSQLSTGRPKGRVVCGIWGQTPNLGDRTFDPVDLAKHRSDGSSRRGAQIWGQARCLGTDGANRGTGTMSDTPIRNVERPTLNSQLSTGRPKRRMGGGIWGQTRNLGDRTFDRVDLAKHRSDGSSWRGAQIWGQARCLGTGGANRGTGTMSDTPIRNVERPTLNSQLSTGRPKGRVVGGIWGQTPNLGGRTFDPVDLAKHRSDGSSRRGAQIWGQARCLGTGGANRGTGTMSDTPIRNVQRTTLNSQLSTG